MVEIREETTERSTTPPMNNANAQQSTSSTTSGAQRCSIIDYLKIRPTDTVIFLTRLMTVFCTVYYILPFGARNAQLSAYSKAFIAAAATNAMRVHQRVGGVRFTREFLSTVLLEDSCHYLIYSILFISASPVTMALMPIFLYAVLHSTDFVKKMCFETGMAVPIAHKASELITQHTQNVLGVIACSEIFVMPILIAMIFAGKASIFLPFIYYRFLCLRYLSRRNHTTKMVFSQLRASLEQIGMNPSVPQVLRNILSSVISLICRLCPAAPIA